MRSSTLTAQILLPSKKALRLSAVVEFDSGREFGVYDFKSALYMLNRDLGVDT